MVQRAVVVLIIQQHNLFADLVGKLAAEQLCECVIRYLVVDWFDDVVVAS